MIREGQSRDAKRYEALREMGCIACRINGVPGIPAEVHHLVDKGYRKHSGGNQATIPLCSYHHRGEPFMGNTVTQMRMLLGPSMALERREFEKVYGRQRDLLALVNEMLRSGKRSES